MYCIFKIIYSTFIFEAKNSERNQQIHTRHVSINEMYRNMCARVCVCVCMSQREIDLIHFWKTFWCLLLFIIFVVVFFGFHFLYCIFVLLKQSWNKDENENVEKLSKQLVGVCYFCRRFSSLHRRNKMQINVLNITTFISLTSVKENSLFCSQKVQIHICMVFTHTRAYLLFSFCQFFFVYFALYASILLISSLFPFI